MAEMNVEGMIRRCKTSMCLMTTVFTLNFAAYRTLEGLESSVNPDDGLIALCALYSVYLLSSMLLPPVILPRFRTKYVIVCSLAVYTLYTAAHFYPRSWTLIPSAIMAGIAGGTLWSGTRLYVSKIAMVHAKLANADQVKMTGVYFGIFFLSSSAMVIGNAAGALINFLKATAYDEEGVVELYQDNVTSIQPYTTTAYPNETECGMFYLIKPESKKVDNELPESTTFIMVSVFLALQVLGIILTFFLVDVSEIRLTVTANKISSTIQINPDGSQLLVDCRKEDSKRVSEKDTAFVSSLSIHNNNNEISINIDAIEEEKLALKAKSLDIDESNVNITAPKKMTIFSSLSSIFRLLSEDIKAVLMILLTLNYGFIHSFVGGDFTRSWITCVFGVDHVMFAMALFGGVTTLASGCSGYLLRIIPLTVLLWATTCVQATVMAVLFIWTPVAEDKWLFYVISAAFGFCFGIFRCQVPNVYSVFWKDRLPTAMALLGSSEAVAYALMFGLGEVEPFVKAVIMLFTLLIGSGMCTLAWNLNKQNKGCKGCVK